MAQIDVTPARDNLVVERQKVSKVLSLHLPESSDRFRYIVVATGPDVEDCAPGDEVILRARGTAQLIDGLEDHAIVSAGDVLATVKRS